MSLLDDIKKNALKTGTKIQKPDAAMLERLLNNTFYLEKDIENETAFIRSVMTRGQETQERKGLHASAIIVSSDKYCLRQQVLSLYFKQLQGEQVSIGLKRIFEEGNAIHEKWQRLFIRAGYAKPWTLDRTREDKVYNLSYSPDIVCRIPGYNNGAAAIVEIKSVNPMQFTKMVKHPSAQKQLQLYMHLCIRSKIAEGTWNGKDYTKGFVLCDDKGTQDFKIFTYDYDRDFLKLYIKRLEDIRYYADEFERTDSLPKRKKACTGYTSECASKCPLKDACYNKGIGAVWL